MNRAMKFALEDGAIDFAEFFGGGGIFDADNDAIGMEKIVNGGAFAEKFGIGGDAKFYGSALGISG